MKKMIAGLVILGLLTPVLLRAAQQPVEIKRVRSAAAQSPILAGVVVPPGATYVYLSGQVPAAADASKPAETAEAYGDTKTQAVSALNKIKGLLADQNLSLGDVIKLTVYLVGDPTKGGKLDFKGFSDAYAQFFGTPGQPNLVARTTVQVVALANPGFLVEIDAIAAKIEHP
ncbi:MAG: RidA family protein [Polyangiaceae bacterium]|jgi:enamine deaminase RidA (YjgF/YER057c/UK114 family)